MFAFFIFESAKIVNIKKIRKISCQIIDDVTLVVWVQSHLRASAFHSIGKLRQAV